jgi:UDP-glucose 4-epimerase
VHKIAIVGGAGYIGSMLSNYLSDTFEVKVLDKKHPPKQLRSNIEYQECDICQYSEIKQGLKDINLVIHTAVVQIPLINEAKHLGYEVNVIGTQNICKVVNESPSIKGMILSGSWHVFGEQDFTGTINEAFGFRPDKVEDRALLYCLSKIAQEVIVRMYDEFSSKIYAVIRMGTVLGEGMPEKTAANIFITKGLNGETLTPYKHSMHRPMLYIDINDVCRAYHAYSLKILNGTMQSDRKNSLDHVVNLVWPQPITILELSHMIKNSIEKFSYRRIKPSIEIIDKGLASPYTLQSKKKLKIDINKAHKFLHIKLTNPQKSIERIVKHRISIL